jgi:1-acyl-sn-glycerol-3-phosphate acyltransferase
VRITGKENVPKSGAYLITINHVSLFEPPFALAFWPVAAEGAGAVDIWDRTGQSLLVRLYGGIPVHRGEYDRKLIDTLLGVLKSGRPLLIAPEGGRTHTLAMRHALPGAAYLADLADVPVVPVGVVGTNDDFLECALHGRRPKIEMRIGPSYMLPPIAGKGEQRRSARQRNVDLIMRKIAALLPPEYHGVYAEKSILESVSEPNEKG